MTTDKWVIALEFGGQSVKAVSVNSEGDFEGDFNHKNLPFRFKLDQKIPLKYKTFEKNLKDIIKRARNGREISTFSIAAPSPYTTDPLTFQLYQKQSYGNINDHSLNDLLKEAGCKKYYTVNDAAAAAIGEMWKGEISKKGRYMFLTLGTGLGGCYLLDGDIVKGKRIGATESGEIWDYQYKGRNLEDYAGTTKAMVEIYRKLIAKYNIKEDRRVTEEGDIEYLAELSKKDLKLGKEKGVLIEAFKKFGTHLGEGVTELAAKFEPEVIVLSGNIARAYYLFEKEANKVLKEGLNGKVDCSFKQSKLIDKGGLLGAAYAAFSKNPT